MSASWCRLQKQEQDRSRQGTEAVLTTASNGAVRRVRSPADRLCRTGSGSSRRRCRHSRIDTAALLSCCLGVLVGRMRSASLSRSSCLTARQKARGRPAVAQLIGQLVTALLAKLILSLVGRPRLGQRLRRQLLQPAGTLPAREPGKESAMDHDHPGRHPPRPIARRQHVANARRTPCCTSDPDRAFPEAPRG